MAYEIFHRTDLAQSLTNRLLHPDALQTTSRDGLFITGIRRIGKTTFIQQDLIPQLEKEKALVIYVDLWENVEEASPAKKVLDKVRYFLTESAWLKALKAHFPGVSLTFERKQIGGPDGMSLAEVFSELAAKVDVNIVLIIDEIQETLKSNHGRNLLAALKAARDAVNLRPHNPHDTYLFIVGTGSHRSVVTAMASRPSQPFYGADRMDFPVLGDEFIRWQAAQLPEDAKKPTEDALKKGFAILGCRPKVFRQMLAEIQHYSGADIKGFPV